MTLKWESLAPVKKLDLINTETCNGLLVVNKNSRSPLKMLGLCQSLSYDLYRYDVI